MELIDAIHRASKSLASLTPFRFGMDREAYKQALHAAQAWTPILLAATPRPTAKLLDHARRFDAERLIFLAPGDFEDARDALLVVLGEVAAALGSTPQTSGKAAISVVLKDEAQIADPVDARGGVPQRVEILETPVPKLERLLGQGFAISIATLKRQLSLLCPDVGLRAILLANIGEAVTCNAVGAHKSAAIMAGSSAEGLLLAALKQAGDEDCNAAFARAFPQRKARAPEHLSFEESVTLASELGLLLSGTRHFSRGVKDLRNLVHPALEWREGSSPSPAASELAIRSALLLLYDLVAGLSSRRRVEPGF